MAAKPAIICKETCKDDKANGQTHSLGDSATARRGAILSDVDALQKSSWEGWPAFIAAVQVSNLH